MPYRWERQKQNSGRICHWARVSAAAYSMWGKCLFVLFAVQILSTCSQTRIRAGRARGEGKRRRRRDRSGRPTHSNALTVNFPLSHMTTNPPHWQGPAHFDHSFVLEHQEARDWVDYAKAQDQEDVWLYEHYFYGMRNGVVMESGALDGDLFSNSHLFEKFANWTAVHVEADPENYAGLRLNRPNAINVNAALCSEPRLLHYSSEGVKPVRGFIEFMTPSFMKQWHGNSTPNPNPTPPPLSLYPFLPPSPFFHLFALPAL